MKLYFLSGALLIIQFCQAQNYPSPPVLQATDGKQIPVFQYQAGMIFYYPADNYQAGKKAEMVGYSKSLPFAFNTSKDNIITYDTLSGKAFMLRAIQPMLVPIGWKDTVSVTIFELVQVPSGLLMSYTFPYEAMKTSKEEFDNKQLQSIVLPGAVFLNDITAAGASLPGKYFALFPIQIKGEKLKYQQVNILRVENGTPEAPVRLVYKFEGEPEAHIDVVRTGTNVLPAFIEHHQFADFFQAADKDPRASLSKRTTDGKWAAICKGAATENMNLEEVKMALGQPVSHSTETNAGKIIEHYRYNKLEVLMVNDAVTAVLPKD